MTMIWRPPGWSEWGADAFRRARDAARPVLLALVARWSQGSIRMAETSYRDPDVMAAIDRSFIPVWVDVDERPDIADRYELGGWPTTAFLAPDGRILGGQTFTGAGPLAALLGRVAKAFEQRRQELMRPLPVAEARWPYTAVGEPDAAVEAWLGAHLLETYDTEHGGFGHAAKRIHEMPLRLALRWRGADAGQVQAVAAHTLASVGASAIVDDIDGGLFRYAAHRDWTGPSTEKLATVNAAGLRTFLDGWSVLGDARCRDLAGSLVRYLRDRLRDDASARFFSSQCANEEYYRAAPPERARLASPTVDRAIYSAVNAEVARSFVHAGEILGDSNLITQAVTAIDEVLGEAYARGEGVAHAIGRPGVVRGLLVDHVLMGETLLDVYEVTDMEVYLDLAHELMRHALRVLWHRARGVFVDRVVNHDDVGLLRRPIAPFDLNCRAASVLARIARRTGQRELLEPARTALGGQTDRARARSIDAASYVAAMAEVSSG